MVRRWIILIFLLSPQMSSLNKFRLACLTAIIITCFFFLSHRSVPVPTESYPIAFVLPHNPTFNQQINQIISQSASGKIKTIIIFGPNHKDIGPHIITNQNHLAEKLEVAVDEDLIKTEHSITVLMPLIQPHYPKAEVIPFIFRRGLSLKKILSFGQKLKDNLNLSQTLPIGSVDFSHYISEEEADKNDQETLKAIEQADYHRLNQFGPGHLDCSSCLVALLELTKKAEPIVLDHTYYDGTSYFFLSLQKL